MAAACRAPSRSRRSRDAQRILDDVRTDLKRGRLDVELAAMGSREKGP